jgi:glycosyltransferase involved in cell wall biosynthesis
MIKFSVITCTYNAADVLQPTLKSVLNQSFSDVEHLIIDGNSTDGTIEIAQNYKNDSDAKECGHDIIVTSEPDKGLYDAMNKGIRKATGTYILFLNAGDTFPSSETLQDVAASVADGEKLPGVIYGDTDVVDKDGHFVRHRRLAAPEKLSWRSFRKGMLVCHQAFYALTDIAKNNPYDLKYKYSADVDWCIRVMKEAEQRGLKLRKVGEVVVNFLDGGMSKTNHKASLLERFNIMKHHYGLFTTIMMHILFVFRSLKK